MHGIDEEWVVGMTFWDAEGCKHEAQCRIRLTLSTCRAVAEIRSYLAPLSPSPHGLHRIRDLLTLLGLDRRLPFV
ncbi:hypothetical protein CLOM_g23881 [Closterium sp. NIES-68]|nr:hypothetical protein CLOM_g23881 [Closterium sp. NIES-68]